MLHMLTVTENGQEETYFASNSWETKKLRKEVQRVIPRAEPKATVTIYAKFERAGSDVHSVVKWSLSDLYSYAQPPQVELANFFGVLLDKCNAISEHHPLEFEMQTVNFWSEARKLTEFFGMSDPYDELLTTFQILSVGYNGILDATKIAALRSVLEQARELINLTDEVLDAMLDVLASAGFDLQAPMSFA